MTAVCAPTQISAFDDISLKLVSVNVYGRMTRVVMTRISEFFDRLDRSSESPRSMSCQTTRPLTPTERGETGGRRCSAAPREQWPGTVSKALVGCHGRQCVVVIGTTPHTFRSPTTKPIFGSRGSARASARPRRLGNTRRPLRVHAGPVRACTCSGRARGGLQAGCGSGRPRLRLASSGRRG